MSEFDTSGPLHSTLELTRNIPLTLMSSETSWPALLIVITVILQILIWSKHFVLDSCYLNIKEYCGNQLNYMEFIKYAIILAHGAVLSKYIFITALSLRGSLAAVKMCC